MTGDESDANRLVLLRTAFVGAAGLVTVAAVVFSILPNGSLTRWWEGYDAVAGMLFLATFGVVGATLAVGWRRGCRLAAVGIAGLLLALVAFPAVAFDGRPDSRFVLGGTALVVVPFALVAVPLEHALRTTDRPRPSRIEWVALAVGVGHLLAVHRLKAILERRPLFPSLAELGAVDGFGFAALVLFSVGLILLGAAPVVLAVRLRLVTPPTVVLGGLGWAACRTWLQSLETLPPTGPGFGISPTPLSLYAWGSSVLLAGVLAVAGLEYLARRTLGIAPPPSSDGGSGGE